MAFVKELESLIFLSILMILEVWRQMCKRQQVRMEFWQVRTFPEDDNDTNSSSGQGVDSPTYDDHLLNSFLVASTVAYAVIGLFIFAGNVLTVLAIRRFRHLSMVVSNSFIISLSVGDLINVHCYFLFSLKIYGPANKASAVSYIALVNWPVFVSSNISLATLLLIAVDRLLAVTRPMAYKTLMTLRTARILICLIWTYVVTLTAVSTLYYGFRADPRVVIDADWTQWMPQTLISYQTTQTYILVISTSVLYVIIFFIILYHSKKVFGGVQQAMTSNSLREKNTRRIVKMTKMMATIVLALLLAWLPYNMYVQLAPPTSPHYFYVNRCLHLLSTTNSCVNPLIYCWQNREFRLAFMLILRMKPKPNQVMALNLDPERTAPSHISSNGLDPTA